MRIRRQARRLPLPHRVTRESGEIMTRERLVHRLLRVSRLNDHLPMAGMPPGATRHLHQLREQALRCTKILRKKHRVGVQHADQAKIGKIVSLGDHLCSHKDIDLVCVDAIKERLRAAFQARGVGIDARNACLREKFGEVLLDALGATPHRLQILVAAIRASGRHATLVPAVVTMQLMPAELPAMQHRIRRATGALTHPAAGCTMQRWRISAAVQVDQHLFVVVEPTSHRLQQLRGHAVFHRQAAGVNQPDGRHLHIPGTIGQVQPPVMPALGVDPTFKGRRR